MKESEILMIKESLRKEILEDLKNDTIDQYDEKIINEFFGTIEKEHIILLQIKNIFSHKPEETYENLINFIDQIEEIIMAEKYEDKMLNNDEQERD